MRELKLYPSGDSRKLWSYGKRGPYPVFHSLHSYDDEFFSFGN